MSVKYDEYFQKASEKYDIDKNLLIAVAQTESGIKADAVSSAGAVGVMQLMPTTAKSLGVTDSYDAEQNIMGGAKYLSQLLTEFDGNTELALSAYNGGASRVKENGSVLSYTEGYVNKVLENYKTSNTYTGTVSRETEETELVWWGDIVRVVLILLVIIVAFILVVVALGQSGVPMSKKDVVEKVVTGVANGN